VSLSPPDLPSSADPRAVLAWAASAFDGRIALSTSLGPQSLIVIDLLHRMGLRVPLFLLDTGLLFAETYALKRQVEERYGVSIRSVRPPSDVADQAAAHGPRLWERDPDRCCSLRKVAPLKVALQGLDAWITGIRADQTTTRARARALEWDERFGLLKINPLVSWSRADVDRYVADHEVPINPLLRQGFRSIGCEPCTSLPHPHNGDERAGRWAGRDKTECGIHQRLPILDLEMSP
jgi:phosphoadenylyl-sulfate reductase (thioredoxin)